MKWNDDYVSSQLVSSLTEGFLETHIDATGIRIRQLTEPEFTTAPSQHELDVLDEATARFEQRVAHLLESKETLEKRHAELIEFRHVLRETASFFNVTAPMVWLTIGRNYC
jgi:hypothetical protein